MIAKKLAIQEETQTIKKGCCIPIIQDGETKRMTFNVFQESVFNSKNRITDLNDLKTGLFYFGNDVQNSPLEKNNYGLVLCLGVENIKHHKWYFQLLYPTVENVLYYRNNINGGFFSEWKQLH